MPHANVTGEHLRGLWLARELPFPPDMGDKVYSGNLARALAEAGAEITFVGLQPESTQIVLPNWPLKWSAVPGRRLSKVRSVLSTLPVVSASYATTAYKKHLRKLMRSAWDFIVLDQFAMGWALGILNAAYSHSKRPLLVHVSHNHETSLWQSFYRDVQGSKGRQVVLWQNYLKVRFLERSLVQKVDVLTAITEEDAAKFNRERPGVRTLVLTPGYNGTPSSRTAITEQTPRRVVLVGSFNWAVKQENLRQFIQCADPIFAKRDIEFLVVGVMPEKLSNEIKSTTKATQLAGFVDDLKPVLASSRIAVVPEAIGGGFKLKFLDYVFGRLPVATLTQAAAGLPHEMRDAMLCRNGLGELATAIADVIDDIACLDRMQEMAFGAARELFRWSDRGHILLSAIQERGTELKRPRRDIEA